MENYEIKQAFKNLPDAGLPNNEPVMCREYEQCDGCNYPAHGFICWHGDGKCLRTEMQPLKAPCLQLTKSLLHPAPKKSRMKTQIPLMKKYPLTRS